MVTHEHGTAWAKGAVNLLLDKVKQEEVLWNIRHPCYNKKNLKRSLFDKICQQMQTEYPGMEYVTTDEVVNKFKYCRGQFQKMLRKVNATPNDKTMPKWEFYSACAFLQPVYDNGTNDSSFMLPENTTEFMYEGSVDNIETSNTEISPSKPQVRSTKNTSSRKAAASQRRASSPFGTANSPSSSPNHQSNTPTQPNCTSTPTFTQATKMHHSSFKSIRKRKADCSDIDVLQRKIMDSLEFVNKAWKSQSSQPFRYDAATEAVMSFMNHIPDSHQHLKDEFTERVFVMVSEVMKKYNCDKDENDFEDDENIEGEEHNSEREENQYESEENNDETEDNNDERKDNSDEREENNDDREDDDDIDENNDDREDSEGENSYEREEQFDEDENE